MRQTSDQRAKKVAQTRAMTLQSFIELRERGTCNRQAGRAVGVPFQTLYRWRQRFEQGGMEGLAPRHSNSGRRSAAAGVRLNSKAVRELEWLILEYGDQQRAWLAFVKSPACPPAVAGLGLRTMPAPVARLVKLAPLPVCCRVSANGLRIYLKVNKKGGK